MGCTSIIQITCTLANSTEINSPVFSLAIVCTFSRAASPMTATLCGETSPIIYIIDFDQTFSLHHGILYIMVVFLRSSLGTVCGGH